VPGEIDHLLPLKVLTLHEPWSSLIAAGAKTIETRQKRTHYRGWLGIHSAKRSMDADAMALYFANRDVLCEHLDADRWEILPFGRLVAVCRLVDCVPIVDKDETTDHHAHVVWGRHVPDRLLLCRPSEGYHTGGGFLSTPEPHFEWATEDISAQAPYGDYRPGRFAWLLEDVMALAQPLDPPPGGFHRGLWTWGVA
jgi:hypothetical protein